MKDRLYRLKIVAKVGKYSGRVFLQPTHRPLSLSNTPALPAGYGRRRRHQYRRRKNPLRSAAFRPSRWQASRILSEEPLKRVKDYWSFPECVPYLLFYSNV